MIVRIWQGWTSHDDADEYERLLTLEIIPSIEAKGISGLKEVEVFRRETDIETEFMTKYVFTGIEALKAMAGEELEKAYVPLNARKLLKRFEATARHFEKRFLGVYTG
ncbi:antibiotic biosynthesis monooxygenase [Ruegeria sp. R14_0]|uniref:antibiotic biosynthesis monooxygenase n=1 Tax=Ruegeria sp. R14_0 TaxID=2821100 RepID=UPI001ADBB0E5|nr:antibiotic biosynthesis monooxygenase [Ruegeria sp. R14_0]MBO9447454.1 antibiotic biosynthesis monooxygenase [Ruegeria sp. R14_0]